MAVTPADVLFPKGRIRAALFGTSAETAEVVGVLCQSVAAEHAAASTAAQAAAVEARALRAKADDLNAEAAEVDVDDEGRRRVLDRQIRYYEREAEAAEARAVALLPAEAEADPFEGWPRVHSVR